LPAKFLPRDAMLAHYMLWPCVRRPSVGHTSVFYRNGWKYRTGFRYRSFRRFILQQIQRPDASYHV